MFFIAQISALSRSANVFAANSGFPVISHTLLMTEILGSTHALGSLFLSLLAIRPSRIAGFINVTELFASCNDFIN